MECILLTADMMHKCKQHVIIFSYHNISTNGSRSFSQLVKHNSIAHNKTFGLLATHILTCHTLRLQSLP